MTGRKIIIKSKIIIINFIEFYFSKLWKKRVFKTQIFSNINNLKERLIEPEILILNQFLNESDVVFDVGANVGQYTFEFESYVNSRNVFSFEPIRASFLRLKRLFSDCNINEIALSDRIGFSEFKIPIINSVEFMTRGSLNTSFVETGENDSIMSEVKVDTLDNFCVEKSIKQLNFLKIDVEGHEFEVIKGGKESILKYFPTMLVEIEQRHHSYPINEIFDFINKLDYHIFFYNHSLLRFQPINDFEVKRHQNKVYIKTFEYINNFFCIHSSNKEHLKIVKTK